MTSRVFPPLIPWLSHSGSWQTTLFRRPLLLPQADTSFPSCAFCILPCFLLLARLDLCRSSVHVCWTGLLEGSAPLTDPGYKGKCILLLGMNSHHPSSTQLTPKQTWWNMSWWPLCPRLGRPEVDVNKPPFASHFMKWFSQSRIEASISEVVVESTKSPSESHLLAPRAFVHLVCKANNCLHVGESKASAAWSCRALESLPVCDSRVKRQRRDRVAEH